MGEKCCKFCTFDCAPCARLEIFKSNVEDASSLEFGDGIKKRGDHATYLVLLSFGECDVEALRSCLSYSAGFGEISFDIDSGFHRFLEALAQFFGGAHPILFVVRIVGIEEAVGYAPVVGEDDQSA